MAFVTPPNFTTNLVVTAANLNTLADDIAHLQGATGSYTINDTVSGSALATTNPAGGAIFSWYRPGAAADETRADVLATSSGLLFRTVNDAYSIGRTYLQVRRSGARPSMIQWFARGTGGMVHWSGTAIASGTVTILPAGSITRRIYLSVSGQILGREYVDFQNRMYTVAVTDESSQFSLFQPNDGTIRLSSTGGNLGIQGLGGTYDVSLFGVYQ